MPGGFAGHSRVLGLLAGQLGGFEQLQHAQHAIHGGAQLVAHHREEFRLGAVGLLGLLAGLDQLGNGLFLFCAGLFQCAGQVVDVACQVAQLAVVDHRQRGVVVTLLDGLYRMAHVADRLCEAHGQAPCEQEGEQQGEQRQDASLDNDLLLALAEGVVRHADDHPPQIIVPDRRRRRFALLQEVVVQAYLLKPDRRLEHLHALCPVSALV
ncbi:hypothetical protein D3C78_691200 [compost metagenome]